MTRKELILATAIDCASNFMYYDRKEDEELPCGQIQEAVRAGEITPKEIAEAFILATGVWDICPILSSKKK